MFMNRVGAQFQCEGVTYTIGGKVCANDASDYEGLYGTITEIRDGDDRETENDTPDIYCSFMPPVLADDIKAIESRFSQLYRREMHIWKILDWTQSSWLPICSRCWNQYPHGKN